MCEYQFEYPLVRPILTFEEKWAKSRKKAFRWYKMAAEQGYAPAQKNVGIMYTHGNGIKQNHIKGFRWLQKAASQNDTDALFFLAPSSMSGDKALRKTLPRQGNGTKKQRRPAPGMIKILK